MRFHPLRDRLLAEAHARPSTPLDAPMLVTRLAALSGIEGAEADRAHMAALCAALGQPGPAPGMKWWALDTGDWQLRWERHSEFSSWTVQRLPRDAGDTDGADVVPPDWIAALPGPVLVFSTVRLRRAHHSHAAPDNRQDVIGSRLLDGAATLLTDLRPDARGMTCFDVVLHSGDEVVAGRITLTLLEIETYRLLALLAFPLAGEAAAQVSEVEVEAGVLASQMAEEHGVEGDRALLTRLVALSGRMEALSASTNFRFAAANAYYEIVQNRIASLREAPVPGLQTIATFMERRLAPAMRTCTSVSAREAAVVDRMARAGQMLNTRIDLVTQVINADLLASMDRRAQTQLKLQRTVEGLSVAAIAYYVVSLIGYVFKGFEHHVPGFSAPAATAIATPLLILLVWLGVRRVRRSFDGEH
jgi:uncharacterized membrane-anchored protein